MDPALAEEIEHEKAATLHIENQYKAANEAHEKQPEEEPALRRAQARRLLLMTDLRVLPMLAIIYSVSIIDRINIGSAQVLGMAEDLVLTGSRYSIVLLLFFPSYALVDIPSNWLLVRLSPKVWMSFIVFGWGAVLCGMGFVKSWQVLAFLRFLLGAFEAGVLPGMVYIIGTWYARYEMHQRISASYGLAVLASAFAGFLSYALGLLRGHRGMKGWRWIFSIEGAASMLIGMISYFFIPNFPDRAKWLKPNEKAFLMEKLQRDRGDHNTERLNTKILLETLSDWIIWVHAVIYMFNVSTANAIGFFGPSILKGLGYSGLKATLYSAWPFLPTIGALAIGSYISDRTKLRSPVIIVQGLIQLIGFVLIRPYYSNEVRYLGLFLGTMGTHCNTPSLLAFSQGNTIGSGARGVSSGFIIAAGAVGGIIGSCIFRSQDAPTYGPGIYTTIGFAAFNIIGVSVLAIIYHVRNRAADRNGALIGGVEGYRYSL